jgi:prepilin-type N-terminal cleavage/methylation domain-containing protein
MATVMGEVATMMWTRELETKACEAGRPIARRGRHGGFTLIEVMVAMTILGFGIVGLVLMQVQALQHSSHGRENTRALGIARSAFEQMPRLPFSSLPADDIWKTPAWVVKRGLLGTDPDLLAGVVGDRVTDGSGYDHFQQMYRVWYRMGGDPSATPDDRIRAVEVRVIWSDENDVSVTPGGMTDEQFVSLRGLIADNDR